MKMTLATALIALAYYVAASIRLAFASNRAKRFAILGNLDARISRLN